MYTEQELEQEVLRRLTAAMAEHREEMDMLRKELEAIKTDLVAAKYALRGIVAERARVEITLSAHLSGKDALEGMRVFGENAAHELLRLAKRDFRDHARMYEMRRYIMYLQNHASSNGVKFTELGKDNYGLRDIFAPDYSPHGYQLPSIKDYLDDRIQNNCPRRTHLHAPPKDGE